MTDNYPAVIVSYRDPVDMWLLVNQKHKTLHLIKGGAKKSVCGIPDTVGFCIPFRRDTEKCSQCLRDE